MTSMPTSDTAEAVLADGDALTFPEPVAWFDAWLADARATAMANPEAMSLATVDPDGRPSLRTVLLKQHDAEGAVFYTNTNSRKGLALAAHADVALLFYWRELDRQVRIEGRATPVDPAEADAYFASRARGSQLGAWASLQSEILPDRATLAERLRAVETRYFDAEVPRPPHWSGYRVWPTRYEFWYGRTHRLHVRWQFHRNADGHGADWTAEQLYP